MNIYNSINFKGAIFDMDGLIFDTEKIYHKVWKIIGKEYGYDITEDVIFNMMGLNYESSLNYLTSVFGKNFPFDEIRDKKDLMVKETLKNNPPQIKPGFKELIDYLKSKKKKIALATSTGKEKATKLLKSANISNVFDETVFGDEIKSSKPNPEIFLKAAEKIKTDIKECIIFEDSFNGIKAAYSSGGIPIMIPDTAEPNDEIKTKCFRIQKTLWEL